MKQRRGSIIQWSRISTIVAISPDMEDIELLQRELSIKFFFQSTVDFVDIFGVWAILVVMRYCKIGLPQTIPTSAWVTLNQQYAVSVVLEIFAFVGGVYLIGTKLHCKNFMPIQNSKPILLKHTFPTVVATIAIAIVVIYVCFDPGDRSELILA